MDKISFPFIISSCPLVLLSINDKNEFIGKVISATLIALIFWGVSAISRSSKDRKDKADEVSPLNNQNENLEVNSPINNSTEPIRTYTAPDIISQKRSVENAFWVGSDENILLEFADGVKGNIFYKQLKNEYYFKEISQYSTIFHYYDNFTNCVNAFHYFETKGEVLEPKLSDLLKKK